MIFHFHKPPFEGPNEIKESVSTPFMSYSLCLVEIMCMNDATISAAPSLALCQLYTCQGVMCLLSQNCCHQKAVCMGDKNLLFCL